MESNTSGAQGATFFGGSLPKSPLPSFYIHLVSPDGWCFGRESVEAALKAIAQVKIIVVTDDDNSENKGDHIIAADNVTPEAIAVMIRYTSGVIRCAAEVQHLERIHLQHMVANNTDPKNRAFNIICNFRHRTSTSISPTDFAKTLPAPADPQSHPDSFQRPMHIFPLRYRDSGVLERAGHTEAFEDVSRLALCPLVGENLVTQIAGTSAHLPTRNGGLDALAYRPVLDDVDYFGIVVSGGYDPQNPRFDGPVVVKVEFEWCTEDIFGSLLCDFGP
ncbi:unnamed protein product [Agarophyton chilense]